MALRGQSDDLSRNSGRVSGHRPRRPGREAISLLMPYGNLIPHVELGRILRSLLSRKVIFAQNIGLVDFTTRSSKERYDPAKHSIVLALYDNTFPSFVVRHIKNSEVRVRSYRSPATTGWNS